ncbi:MAG TPA: type II secretion system F family protein [Chloroflexota bacterium]|nr:type II secretion system F family protein [Chloroflexota bacterium]
MIVVLPILVFGTILFIAFAFSAPAESVIQQRLKTYGYTATGRDLSAPFTERVVVPLLGGIASLIGRLSPQTMGERVRLRLAQAGHPGGMSGSTFGLIKVGGLLLFPAIFVGPSILSGQIEFRTIVLLVVLAYLGWWLPEFWLSSRIGQRQYKIERALPDAVDLIVVCVEAGNALEAALANVTQKLKGPLAEEFDRTLREISMGRPRREALRDLGHRAGVNDLQAFIAAILQADSLGVSIAQTLRIQSDAMRVRRRQRAEEQAAKLPVKMLFPLITLIFPALMIVILGPAVVKLMAFFAHTPVPGG